MKFNFEYGNTDEYFQNQINDGLVYLDPEQSSVKTENPETFLQRVQGSELYIGDSVPVGNVHLEYDNHDLERLGAVKKQLNYVPNVELNRMTLVGPGYPEDVSSDIEFPLDDKEVIEDYLDSAEGNEPLIGFQVNHQVTNEPLDEVILEGSTAWIGPESEHDDVNSFRNSIERQLGIHGDDINPHTTQGHDPRALMKLAYQH
ncbi:hypothetical protein AQV86_04810 [Nanohaloarchaea archaeon SG9]|nr:hypothetical protein AQV86_04810 [Nanohaloarchaea archaeon SG9]